MGWAAGHIERLLRGETRSALAAAPCAARIESGQLCTVTPVDPATLGVGAIVLCRVKGAAIDGGRFLIGNNSRAPEGIAGRSADRDAG